MTAFIIGFCRDMCPEAEVRMRTQKRLIHKLESGPGLKPVKEFKRSAAGMREESGSDIRTPDVLQTTVTYLFNEILPKEKSLENYDFLANRLRAVQQDLFKQQCTAKIALPIIEPIVRYYAWASFWYSEEPAFDRHNHEILLLESIKDCLRLSDECNFPASIDIEAMYILYALGEQDPLLRVLKTPCKQKHPLLMQAYRLSLFWFLGNFVAVCLMIKQLPLLLAALICVRHLVIIQRHGLEVMSTAYSCKNTITPLHSLVHSHLFTTEVDAEDSCHFYGITIQNGGIVFRKSSFNPKAQMKSFKRPAWILKKFANLDLSNLFFNGTEEIIG